MDFVTITDHNRIEGCLEIADLPGVFISEQVTQSLPGRSLRSSSPRLGDHGGAAPRNPDVRGRTFSIFSAISRRSDIAHAVAHPLYRLDERLTLAHIEKLILLFRHFEGINGQRDALLSEAARFAFSRLDAGENRGTARTATPSPPPIPSRGKKCSSPARMITAASTRPPPSRRPPAAPSRNFWPSIRAGPLHDARHRRHAARRFAQPLQ